MFQFLAPCSFLEHLSPALESFPAGDLELPGVAQFRSLAHGGAMRWPCGCLRFPSRLRDGCRRSWWCPLAMSGTSADLCTGFGTGRKEWEEHRSRDHWAGEGSAGLQAGACSHRFSSACAAAPWIPVEGLVAAAWCDLPRHGVNAVRAIPLGLEKVTICQVTCLVLKQLCAPLV